MVSQELPLVSIVTPFYNTDHYLSECIESVLSQTYPHFEYILVNNCSTDQSLAIALQYAERDRRIKVYENGQFLTQLENYNGALRKISPESRYCKIVQADDAILPTCLEEMVKVARENSEIGIVSAYIQHGATGVLNVGLPYPRRVFPGSEPCRLLLLNSRNVFGSQTAILIRSDLIRKRNPFFNEGSLYADAESCFELLQECSFGFVHQVLTFQRIDDHSMTGLVKCLDPHYLVFRLMILKKYGPIYLTKDEYARRTQELRHRHLMFLADAALSLRDHRFWEFHRKDLSSCGWEWRWWELAGCFILVIVDLIGNPKNTVKRVLGKCRSIVGAWMGKTQRGRLSDQRGKVVTP